MKSNFKTKFSIIVVTLNTKVLFLETLKSIINQTFKDFEVIVVDGSSVDGTKDEILKNKKYFSHFIIEEDNGIYDAMNKGLDKVSGEWTIFMNSGDAFYNKDVLINFDILNNEKFDVIYGDTVIKNNLFKHLHKSEAFNDQTVLMPFCHQSVFVKSNKIKERKFKIQYRYSSDFDFFFESFNKKDKFLKIDSIVSTITSGGSSDINRQMVINENIEILKEKNINKSYYILYYFKLLQFLKSNFRKLIPEKIVLLLLRFKYKKNLVK